MIEKEKKKRGKNKTSAELFYEAREKDINAEADDFLTEDDVQKRCVQFTRHLNSNIFITADTGQNMSTQHKFRAIVYNNKMKAMGRTVGSPDLLFIYRGVVFFVELKARRSGAKMSIDQKDCHEKMRLAGAKTYLIFGVREFEAFIVAKIREIEGRAVKNLEVFEDIERSKYFTNEYIDGIFNS